MKFYATKTVLLLFISSLLTLNSCIGLNPPVYQEMVTETSKVIKTIANVDSNSATASCTNRWDPGKIVFASTTALNGTWDGAGTVANNIWIIDKDGTGLTPLTQNTTNLTSYNPIFSPDKSKILFYSQTALDSSWDGVGPLSTNMWLMNTDGTNRIPLSQNSNANLYSIASGYSPDGTKIVYYSQSALDGTWNGTATSSGNIWIMNADGTNRIALTQNTNANLASLFPRFSPDGTKIVFYSQTALDGTWNGAGTSSNNIWIMNTDGTNRIALTQNSNANLASVQPYFSPDGSKIAFISFTALNGAWNGAATTSNNIWIMNIDGTNRVALTQNTLGSRSSNTPGFNSDGTKIVFSSTTALDGTWDGVATTSSNIWIMNIDGTNRVALTQNTLGSRASSWPSFSPEGSEIVFYSNTALNGAWDGVATSSSNIWTMNIDGTNRTHITSNSLAGLSSSWLRGTDHLSQKQLCD